ncbi:hypothetical protein J6590_085563 [Homalodisca vitripennis]|nr:hypothetical protein J6590_085563 [Homalodisca vitripennis]
MCDAQEKTDEHLLFDCPDIARESYAIFGSLDNGDFSTIPKDSQLEIPQNGREPVMLDAESKLASALSFPETPHDQETNKQSHC